MYFFSLSNLVNSMHFQYVTEVILPCIENNVGICEKMTSLIPYKITFMMVTFRKLIYTSLIFFSYCLFISSP